MREGDSMEYFNRTGSGLSGCWGDMDELEGDAAFVKV